MNSISFGDPDTTWSAYGLSENPVVVNGSATGYKAIIKDEDLVAFVSNRYKLLPNEEAVKAADEAAALSDLVPFDKFQGPWITRFGMKSHVIQDNHRVHALYAHPDKYEVGNEEMYLGVALHNSIDGSMGFKAGIFTFRAACSNVVLTAGMKDWSYYYSQADHGRTVEWLMRKHTKSLVTDKVKDVMIYLMDKTHYIIDTYKLMAQRKITEDLVDQILKSNFITKKILPDYITEPEATLPDLTQWDLYNDLTELIWHNAKAQMKTKLLQFTALHKIMPFEVND